LIALVPERFSVEEKLTVPEKVPLGVLVLYEEFPP